MESQEELQPEDKKGQGLVARWRTELKLAQENFKAWEKRAKRVIEVYRDEDSKHGELTSGRTDFNILWSNIQTLKPALYSRTPQPEVQRRHKDKDVVGRASAQILERALRYSVKSYRFDDSVKAAVMDHLLVGRGTNWVRYIPTIQNGEVVYEEVRCDYVHWSDFVHSPARNWQEVRWVAKRSFLTRGELKSRFGDEIAANVTLDYTPDAVAKKEEYMPQADLFKKATVWEIWDKDSRSVYWISPGLPQSPLDVQSDPLGLKDFFPCPKPLLATTTTDSMVPIPDFCLYQGLADELDEITARIACLVDAIRVRGVYDASLEGLNRLLESGSDNSLIPIDNFQAFAQGGGFDGSIQFMPIGEVVNALIALYQARDQVKATIYEVTGMADIMRGASNPNETATAQQIKGQFASMRLSERQQEVQRFCRDLIAIKGEIISEHFSPQTLIAMTGLEFLAQNDPNPMQSFEQAVQLLRTDLLRSFRISIETDSTLAIDSSIEKQNRIEFVQAASQFIGQAMQAGQMFPQAIPVFGELLMFAIRAYKPGRNLETALEQMVEQAKQMAQQPKEQAPDPQMMEVQRRQQESQMNMALKQKQLELQYGAKQQEFMMKQAEMQNKMQEMAANLAMQQERMRGELALHAEKIRSELQIKGAEMVQKEQLETQKQLIELKKEEMKNIPQPTINMHMPSGKKTAIFRDGPNGTRIAEVIEGE